jgi:DNA-binding beta-propeller fold protein YncE
VAALAGLGACAGPAPQFQSGAQAPELVFPSPPEQPRYYFERSISSSEDVKPREAASKWRSVITGEVQQTGVGMAKPFDVNVCQGRIYVSDSVKNRVFAFDIPRAQFQEIGIAGQGTLRKPMGVATDESCNLYVVDATAKKVVRFNALGEYLGGIGLAEQFSRPSHLAVSPSGDRVYVVDTGGVDSDLHVIHVFDGISGELLYDIGRRGTRDGELNLPRDVELGPDGRLYVIDGGNFRVQVFETDGTFVRTFGSAGAMYGQFSRPKGIGVDGNGNIYVSDAAFGNFQVFNSLGELLLFVGSRSEQPKRAGYMLPAGLDVDEDGRIYMVDQFFRKLDVYRPADVAEDGGFLGSRIPGDAKN